MRQLMFLSFLLLPAVVLGNIYKLAVPSDTGMQFYWWPILPPVSGWHHDEGASRANAVNALVPDGHGFSDAPTVIYAKAIYKPRFPALKSLDDLIQDDRATFQENFPGVIIRSLTAIADGDGRSHPYYSYTPVSSGSWELVAYGEEGDFYLIFTVSGNSKSALDASRKVFESLISHYKESP